MRGFLTLLQLELTLYILIALGVFLRKKGFLNDENESFLSKLTLNVILPCSIIKSFLIEFNGEILKEFSTVLVIALFAAIFQFASGKLFFRFISEEKRKILAYGVINPNCAFLGIPMIVDRSADEKDDLAKAEWIKVYGVIFGCEEQADDLYNKAVQQAGEK